MYFISFVWAWYNIQGMPTPMRYSRSAILLWLCQLLNLMPNFYRGLPRVTCKVIIHRGMSTQWDLYINTRKSKFWNALKSTWYFRGPRRKSFFQMSSIKYLSLWNSGKKNLKRKTILQYGHCVHDKTTFPSPHTKGLLNNLWRRRKNPLPLLGKHTF